MFMVASRSWTGATMLARLLHRLLCAALRGVTGEARAAFGTIILFRMIDHILLDRTLFGLWSNAPLFDKPLLFFSSGEPQFNDFFLCHGFLPFFLK